MRQIFPSFGWTEIGLLIFLIITAWAMLILPMLSIDAYYTWLLLQQPFMIFPIGLTVAATTTIIIIYVQNIRNSFKKALKAYSKMRTETSKEAYKAVLASFADEQTKQEVK